MYADLLVTVMAQAAVELMNTGLDWEPDFHSIYLVSLSSSLAFHNPPPPPTRLWQDSGHAVLLPTVN